MLKVLIKSYDSHFDTFACTFQDEDNPSFESLLPATILPYIAPDLCNACDDLPFDLVGKEFSLRFPAGALELFNQEHAA